MDDWLPTWIFCRMPDHYRSLLRQPPRIILANAYPFAANELIPASCSASEHVMVVIRGKGSLTIGQSQWQLTPGTVAVAPWGVPWELQSAHRPVLAMLSVHLHFLPWYAPAPGELIGWHHGRSEGPPAPQPRAPLGSGVLDVPSSNRVTELALRAAEHWDLRSDPRRELRLRGLALELVGELLPVNRRTSSLHPAAGSIRELLDWLRFAPLNNLTRADLERHSGLGRSTLGAAFRAATGLPP
ncbi:MAG: hypothetical protein AAB263_14280, partial [Planctomycetota bacterium]